VQQLDGLAAGLDGVLEELREIARGLHPAILTRGGLRPALKALARRSAVPVRLEVRVAGRLPEQIEIAAYYVVAEALTNAARHAHATVIDVQVATGESVLWLSVRDDGRGGADVTGSGLVGLRDRAEALGGRLWLRSPPGEGTTLQVQLPVEQARPPVCLVRRLVGNSLKGRHVVGWALGTCGDLLLCTGRRRVARRPAHVCRGPRRPSQGHRRTPWLPGWLPPGICTGNSLVSGLPGAMRLRGTQKVTAIAKNPVTCKNELACRRGTGDRRTSWPRPLAVT
jgi:hypothetical protein